MGRTTGETYLGAGPRRLTLDTGQPKKSFLENPIREKEFKMGNTSRGCRHLLVAALCFCGFSSVSIAQTPPMVIPVGVHPTFLTYDGSNVWVANHDGNSVSKTRASDGTVLGTFPALNPDQMASMAPTSGWSTKAVTR